MNNLTKAIALFRNRLIIAGLITCVIVTIVWITRPIEASTYSSPLFDFQTLKTLEQKSISYDIAIADHKPILLEFYADWCPTCQAIAPKLDQLHEQYGSRINFVMVDIDNPQWRSQIQQYNVFAIPQINILTHDREIIKTINGQVSTVELAQIFDTMLGESVIL